FDGWWSATITDSKGSAQLQLNLIQNSQGDVVGTYTSSLGGGGQVSGTLKDTEWTFELTQSIENCPGIFKGHGIFKGDTLSGSYKGTDCLGDHGSGTFAMSKNTGGTVSAPSVPDEMKRSLAPYLQKKIGSWTQEDAQQELGDSVRHRFVSDRNNT